MSKDQQTLAVANDLAANATTWADLSNALFDPDHGLVARAYPNRAERKRFLETPEYRAIRQLIDDAQQRTGLVAGAMPSDKSGERAFATYEAPRLPAPESVVGAAIREEERDEDHDDDVWEHDYEDEEGD